MCHCEPKAKQSYLHLIVCFVALLLAKTYLISLFRNGLYASREGEDIEKRGFAPLKHPLPRFGFAERYPDKGKKYRLT